MDSNGNPSQLLRVKVKVYPPTVRTFFYLNVRNRVFNTYCLFVFLQEDNDIEFFAYQFLRDSFNAKLEEYQLLYLYELPLSMKIVDLIERVKTDMESSTFNYRFSNALRGRYLEHETLPLHLLAFMNKGKIRPADGQVRIRAAANHADLTVLDIAGNKTRYAVPEIAIEGTRLVIHLGQY